MITVATAIAGALGLSACK
nr:smalltalk protein [Bacteroides uniformis]